MTDLARFVSGEDVSVDVAAIERSLSEVWREQSGVSGEPVTRAALWNVVAHTSTDDEKMHATQTLGVASASVPQRSIVIRSSRDGEDELSSWIGANCHLVSGARQVCSEEISIVAGGKRVRHVPSLMHALLIPDMPVAAWWLGDLPDDDSDYVSAILEPADRLVVDSSHFDHVDDLRLVRRLAEGSSTTPADLNWLRLEDWRIATASMFDPQPMRERLGRVSSVKIVAGESRSRLFGGRVEALYFAAWLSSRLDHHADAGGMFSDRGAIGYDFQMVKPGSEGLLHVEIGFESGGRVLVERHDDRAAIIASTESIPQPLSTVTTHGVKGETDLIVRQLSQRDRDPVFNSILPRAIELSGRLTC